MFSSLTFNFFSRQILVVSGHMYHDSRLLNTALHHDRQQSLPPARSPDNAAFGLLLLSGIKPHPI